LSGPSPTSTKGPSISPVAEPLVVAKDFQTVRFGLDRTKMASAARVSPKFAAYAYNVLLGRDVSTVLKLLSEVAVDAVEQVIPSEVARTAQSSRGTCWGPTLGTASLIARRSDWGCGVAFLGRGSFALLSKGMPSGSMPSNRVTPRRRRSRRGALYIIHMNRNTVHATCK